MNDAFILTMQIDKGADMLDLFIGLIIVVTLIIIANNADKQNRKQKYTRIAETVADDKQMSIASASLIMMGIMMILITVLSVLSVLSNQEADVSLMTLTILQVVMGFLGSYITIRMATSSKVRDFIQTKIIRSDGHDRKYSADSMVHSMAIALVFFYLVNTLGSLVLAGGLDGFADQISSNNMIFSTQLLNFMVYIVVALLGVGLFIRRNTGAVIERLNLNNTTLVGLFTGLFVGIGLFFFQLFGMGLWTVFLSPEQLAEQMAASEQIFNAFSGSLLMALFLALTTGIGEELLFRGAVQPIFGNVWTSVIFALFHAQYTLTPAVVIIFCVSLGFGWLRTRFNTVSAMVAHFIYNLMGFLIFFAAQSLDIPVEAMIR